MNKPIQIPQSIVKFVKSQEGFREQAYQDSGGVWTIGFGTTEGVHAGMTVTKAEAEDFLHRDLMKVAGAIAPLIQVPLTENEWCALVSFSYNVGIHNLQTSTLLKMLNTGDKAGAAEQFLLWDHVHGEEVTGLLNRRKQEQSLFLT